MSFPRAGDVRKNIPASNPISIPSTSIISSNSNLDWSLPPSSPLSPLNSHHTASPPTDLPVDIRPGSPNSLLSVPMLNTSARGDRRTNVSSSRFPSPNLNSPLSPLSPTPSTDLSSPETIQFALPSDFEQDPSPSDVEQAGEKSATSRGGERERKRDAWREGPEGYASDSLSIFRTRRHRRIVPPLLMLNHKRSSSSGLAQRSSSLSASTSPIATHTRFHSQSNMPVFHPKDSFIDLEDTLDDLTNPIHNPNAMYPTPPKRNAAGGLFRHKQSGSIRSVASATSLLPTFIDPSSEDTGYQALPPPSPGLNVPFGGVVVNPAAPASTAAPFAPSNAWKMFTRDKDKDKPPKKKDFGWRINFDDTSSSNDKFNAPSAPSSPTRSPASSSASSKPSKLKNDKKAAKLKSHTYPSENFSPSSSPSVLPTSSRPIPLPFPLPLPPTTNNLNPVARQDLIKKHRKLVKVLGEEPRVVGHLEFIGGSPLIPGQGASLGLHTSSRQHHQQYHHHASSLSASSYNSNLGTFLHLQPRNQKDTKRDNWESNSNAEGHKGGNGKNRTRSSTWADVGTRDAAVQSQRYDYAGGNVKLDSEVLSVLDNAYAEILLHNGDDGGAPSCASDTSTYQPKRRHSTPVTTEFIIDEAERSDSKTKLVSRKKGDDQRPEEKKLKNHRQVQFEEISQQAILHQSEPILVSPTSPVPYAHMSPRGSVSASPISNFSYSPLFPTNVAGACLAEAEAERDSRLRGGLPVEINSFQSPNARSQAHFSYSPPPVLPPLTTSPPRLRIDAGLFDNRNPFCSSAVSGSIVAPGVAISTAASIMDAAPSLHVDTQLKEDIGLNQIFSTKLIDNGAEGTVQEHEPEIPPRSKKQLPLASQAGSPPVSSIKSTTYPVPLPSIKFSSRPLKPQSFGQLSVSGDQAKALSSPIDISNSPFPGKFNIPPSLEYSSPFLAHPSEAVVLTSRRKERSKEKAHRTPVGPNTFVRPTPTPVMPSELEKDTGSKFRRHPHTRTRSESPESFMDMGDDVESPVGPRVEGLQRPERKEQGPFCEGAVSNSTAPYPPLSPSPLSAMSAPPVVIADHNSRSTDSSLSTSLSLDMKTSNHRAASTTSLTPSFASFFTIQTTCASVDDGHPYAHNSHVLTSEQDKRKKMDKIAKLNRFLGDIVPVELVLGEAYVSKDSDLPALTVADGLPGSNKRPLWMRRRRSSSSAALPGYEAIDRRKDDLDSKERIRHVRRGLKMEQMFGMRPPPDLYQIHGRETGERIASSTVPNSPTSPASSPPFQIKMLSKGGVNSSSYKGKAKYSAIRNGTSFNASESAVEGMDYSYAESRLPLMETSTGGSSLDRSLSLSSKARGSLPLLFTSPGAISSGYESLSGRRGSGDSNKPLLAFGQSLPIGGRLRDEADNSGAGMRAPSESNNGSLRSSVYMQYRQSLISLGDMVDKDDKASLAEFRQYLQLPHSTSRTGLGYGYELGCGHKDYDSYDDSDEDAEYDQALFPNKQTEDRLATPTQLTSGSRSSNTPYSTRGEPSRSPQLTRRRSLPSRTSTLSLVSTLSGTSTLSSISALSAGTTATSFSKGLADIPGYYDAPRTEAEGRAAMFKARRRRAAKLTNFFGVKYRDLFGEVLESIEAGMREDVRVGRMGTGELEELMMRVKKLRSRKVQFN